MKIFVVRKMTRNNTPNKVYVSATEHRSCCRRIQICLERQPHKVAVRLCAALKLSAKIVVRRGGTCPSAS